MDKSFFSKWAIRLLAVCLFLFSLQKAWAGIWLYRGKMALEVDDFSRAFGLLKKAQKWDASNPDLLYSLGLSAWKLGSQTGERQWFGAALPFFEEMTRQMPYYGKGWLYFALTRLELENRSPDRITPSEWRALYPLFEKASRGEAGSGWMAFMVGTNLLTYESLLSAGEKSMAFDQLRKSVAFHYPDRSSPYLEPVLSFLWKRYSNFQLLKDMTPVEEDAYGRLIHFMDEKDLWPYRRQIDRKYLEMTLSSYQSACREGERRLEERKPQIALKHFRRAYWKNKDLLFARAGILVTEELAQSLPRDYSKILQEVLEGERDYPETVFQRLSRVVSRSADHYLKGLYAFQKGDFQAAREELEKSKPDSTQKFRRLALSASYWNLGEKDKAAQTLKPVLDEKDPDLRELLLLAGWDIPEGKEAVEKIEGMTTVPLPQKTWWGDSLRRGLLHRKGRMKMELNLKPGPVTIQIPLRGFPDPQGRFPYLLIRLRPSVLDVVYLRGSGWQVFNFKTQTSGGKRRLEIDLENGTEDPAKNRGPIVEAGPVTLLYST